MSQIQLKNAEYVQNSVCVPQHWLIWYVTCSITTFNVCYF